MFFKSLFLLLFFLVIKFSFAQETGIAIKYHLSAQKGKIGSHQYQVPATKIDAGMVVLSAKAQQKTIIPTDTFSVLVWNVEKMTYLSSTSKEVAPNQYYQLQRLFDNYLQQQQVDFCLLQEVQLNNRKTDNFLLDSNYSFIHSSNYYIPKDSARLGTAILTNKKIDSVLIEQSNVRAFFNTGMSKSATYAWMPLTNNSSLLVISIHAINIVNNTTFEKHITQIFQTIKTHSGPVLFAGDFNTWNKNRYKRLTELFAPLGIVIADQSLFVSGKRLQWRKHPLDQVLTRGIKIIDTISVGELNQPADHASLRFQFTFEE